MFEKLRKPKSTPVSASENNPVPEPTENSVGSQGRWKVVVDMRYNEAFKSVGKPFEATVRVYDTHMYTEEEIADSPFGRCSYTKVYNSSAPETAESEVRTLAKEFITDQKRIGGIESPKTFYLDG
jgi:hypothetical protein